jgi:UDP-N-acetylglucosamine 4,6-dehydratase/5-epimerase
MKNFLNKSILITGGTGSFGKSMVKFLLKKNEFKKIIVFSRDELKQSEMKKELKNYSKLRFFIGDVRDYKRLLIATQSVDFIIHAAALKQVDTAEYNPTEYIETNVGGAKNLIEICSQNKIEKIIALSTDKACSPINLYGATKLCSDKLFISANNYITNCKFSVVRYGNVENSRGSVIPLFSSIKKDNFYPVTSNEMTRFSLSLNRSIELVYWTLKNSIGAEIVVPKIPSYKIIDLVKSFNSKAKIKLIGLRPGEKLHEEMISVHDSLNTIEANDKYLILPSSLSTKQKKKYLKKFSAKPVQKNFKYSSNTNKFFLSINELKKIIRLHRF